MFQTLHVDKLKGLTAEIREAHRVAIYTKHCRFLKGLLCLGGFMPTRQQTRCLEDPCYIVFHQTSCLEQCRHPTILAESKHFMVRQKSTRMKIKLKTIF